MKTSITDAPKARKKVMVLTQDRRSMKSPRSTAVTTDQGVPGIAAAEVSFSRPDAGRAA